MKTNPETGELTLESGFVLSPLTTLPDFLSTPEGVRAKLLVKNERWSSFRFEEIGETIACTVLFKSDTLESIHLSMADPKFGNRWKEWSEEKELKRKNANDQWLIGKGLVPGKKYNWGSVTSGYDQKAGSSIILIRYQNDR